MKRILVSFLTITLASTSVLPLPAFSQATYNLSESASMSEAIAVPNGSRMVSISVNHENVRNVLWELSQQGGFNLVMDESVVGKVTLELSKVTLNHALQSISAMNDLLFIKQNGNIFLAITKKAAQDKGIARQLSKVIHISSSNATRVADILNRSIFGGANADAASVGGGGGFGGQATQKVKADPRTNNVIVVGTAREIELAEAAVAKLDVVRQSKTFYLSYANALDVATMLSSSVFNDGTASFRVGAGGGSSTANSAAPSSLRVEKQDIQEGTGVNDFGGSSGSGGGSGGAVSSGFSSQVTLRGFVKSTDTATVSPEGALIVPDTRQNSITIMGTVEQIALAESIIPTLDAQLPQVSIEASLVEISETGVKELSTRLGLGKEGVSGGFNNVALQNVQPPAGTTMIGVPTVDPTEPEAFARSAIVYSTNPLTRSGDYALQIRSLITKQKAKILANPTVVATHDTESIISIVDEIVRRVTTQLDPSGFATQTVEIGEAGIVMDILPKIGEDGTVSLRLRPSVTTVRQETRDSLGNLITLLSKRDLLTQNVRVRDGETLVIGGLIQQNDATRQDKLPFAGDLPIVGALFRATQNSSNRSELVLMLTPHILNKTRLTPVHTSSGSLPLNTPDMTGGAQ